MDRRKFIVRGGYALAGGWLTLSGVGHALACGPYRAHPLPEAVLVIDDIGYGQAIAERFLSIDIPITYAVLPRLKLTRRLAERIHACGREVILHQPMEPIAAGMDPGPGALYVDDRQQDIYRLMEENLKAVPHAIGVNNHMGSRFTQLEAGVTAALSAVRDHDLYFIDSLTTNRSVAHRTARHLGIPCARRNVFLDNVREKEAVYGQLTRLAQQAERWGRAVGIGHPFPETAQAIAEFTVSPRAKRLTWVYASKVMGTGRPRPPEPT